MPKSEKDSVKATAKLPPPSGNEVDAFLEALEHPLRDDVARIRQVILSAAPGITEAVMWNAPSFRTEHHFCTFHLRSKDAVQLVLHRGAKKKAPKQMALSPKAEALVNWLEPDRAMVTIEPSRVGSSKAALTALIREWVSQL